jgi:hypothetical protein
MTSEAVEVDPHENAATLPRDNWRVLPAIASDKIFWLDAAGYPVGTSAIVDKLPSVEKFDFNFDRISNTVTAVEYISPL